MFWEMEKGNHEKALKAINDHLLSFFEFAAQSTSITFVKQEWMAFAENGKKMRRAIDQLFCLKQEEREKIYRAIVHDNDFSKTHKGAFQLESTTLKQEYQEILKDFYLYFYNVSLYSSQFQHKGAKFGRTEFVEKFFEGKNEERLSGMSSTHDGCSKRRRN